MTFIIISSQNKIDLENTYYKPATPVLESIVAVFFVFLDYSIMLSTPIKF